MRWMVALMLLVGPAGAGPIGTDKLYALPAADVVIMGEVHDNPAHHLNQTQAVAAIAPRATVWEMLSPEQVTRLPGDLADRAQVEAALGWSDSGWPDFAMYHPIFTAAPKARVYGADVPRDRVRAAMVTGAARAFGPDAARYGLDLPVPDAAAREAEQADAHCGALPPDLLPGMVEAQRLRDAALAQAVVQAMADTGGPVVVITGNGHARKDSGVPALLRLAAPEMRVLSVGQVESDPGPDAPYDLWLITDAVERPDPCAVFLQGG